MRRLIVVLAAVAAIAVADSAGLRAWGPQGHRLVGLIAAARLSPMAQVNVAWLLDKRSLADVSSWADQNIDGNAQTALWHYLNIPPDATSYDRDRDCPLQPGVTAGSRNDRWRDCAVDRILYSQDRLANTALDRADRAVSLKYLVHFVGDLHQPFHALGVERGGNGILVNVFGSPTCGSGPTPAPCNMHGVWDSILISRRQLDDAQYVAALEQLIAKNGWNQRPIGTPAEWAMQSKDLAKAALVPQQGQIDDVYARAQMPVIDERLALGGIRLASFINAVLTSPPPELAAMIAEQDASRRGSQITGGSSSAPDSIASPTVVTSAFATGTTSGRRLELLVLWRGSPAWFMKGNSHGGSGGGRSGMISASLRRGDLAFNLALDLNTRVLDLDGKTISLGRDNVVLVDNVDRPGGPQVVKTLAIDPVLTEPLTRIQPVLRRSPEIVTFLQCDIRVSDAKLQGYFDQLCAPFTRQ